MAEGINEGDFGFREKGLDVVLQAPTRLPMAGLTGHKQEAYGGGGANYREATREGFGRAPSVASGESAPVIPSVSDARLRGRVAELGGGGGASQAQQRLDQLRDKFAGLTDQEIMLLLLSKEDPDTGFTHFKKVPGEFAKVVRSGKPVTWHIVNILRYPLEFLGFLQARKP